jgi:hypothetical protein
MATIKKSKVTVSFLGIIGILLIATLLLVPATQARAETVKFRVVNYLVKVEWSPVGDVEGHLIGFFLRGALSFMKTARLRPTRPGARLTLSKGEVHMRDMASRHLKTVLQSYQKFKAPSPQLKAPSKDQVRARANTLRGPAASKESRGAFHTPASRSRPIPRKRVPFPMLTTM